MDKGKVFRNLAKKKLAEYIQSKEQKGEQAITSETVPTQKETIKKITPRKAFRINLKLVSADGQLIRNLPVEINAVLSIGEKKKLLTTIKSIENAGQTSSSDVLVQRLDNLLKKILRESGSYSADYIDAFKKVLEEITVSDNRIVQIFPSFTNNPINKAKFKNFINQIVETLDEKKERIKDELEVEENILPSTQEEGQESADIELRTVGFPQVGRGMRKGKYNTYRGVIGYGDNMDDGCGKKIKIKKKSKMPESVPVVVSDASIDKGFATAPMNANSPFGQPAFKAPQSNAIPKFLNIGMIPNKKGNFAVLG
jgi:hypothetical protein